MCFVGDVRVGVMIYFSSKFRIQLRYKQIQAYSHEHEALFPIKDGAYAYVTINYQSHAWDGIDWVNANAAAQHPWTELKHNNHGASEEKKL